MKLEEALCHEFVGNHFCDNGSLTACFDLAEKLLKEGKKEQALKVYNHAAVEGMGLEPATEEEMIIDLTTEW